jgi:hypothetical protein
MSKPIIIIIIKVREREINNFISVISTFLFIFSSFLSFFFLLLLIGLKIKIIIALTFFNKKLCFKLGILKMN